MANHLTQAQVTTLLTQWRDGGDEQARDRLVSIVYDELRRLARACLRQEASGHSLQPTELVNELYLRLFTSSSIGIADRAHLFAIAARQMRRILVDHARARKAQKRGAGLVVNVDQTVLGFAAASPSPDLLAVDDALSQLAEFDERAAQVVELRFFTGATEVETAAALGISLSSAKRDWDFARAWLHKHLASG
jgi:RNA polymerase sigma-70 factor (ECF subfamily)